MSIIPTPNKIRNLVTVLILLCSVSFLFAAESSNITFGNKGNLTPSKSKQAAQKEKDLTAVQKEARAYREQGLKLQEAGDLDGAMSLFQKAIILDSTYAEAYNDLGVIYEAKGFIPRAEESYKKCITIDPSILAAYTNLALLSENKRDIKSAAFYWEKRALLGSPEDPWTKKAKQRLSDIRLVLSDKPFCEAKEKEVIGLMGEVSNQKAAAKKDNKVLARSYFDKAKICYKKGDEVTALKIAIDAAQLDPSNKEIKEFVQKVQTRVLSK